MEWLIVSTNTNYTKICFAEKLQGSAYQKNVDSPVFHVIPGHDRADICIQVKVASSIRVLLFCQSQFF